MSSVSPWVVPRVAAQRSRRRDITPTFRRSAGLALLVVAAVTALAGCGGSGSPRVAALRNSGRGSGNSTTAPLAGTATGSGTTAAGSGAPQSSAQLQEDALKFSVCMRANGVPNYPDPDTHGGFVFHPGAGLDPSSPAVRSAQAKCQKLMPGGGFPPAGSTTHPSAQWLAEMVKVAECMRRHGISGFPEPTTTAPRLPAHGGVISDIEGVFFVFPASLNTQSPLFTHVATTCGFPLHNH